MLIEKDAFNDQILFEVYKNAYMQPTQDDDGRVKLHIDGINISAVAMPDRPFFVLSTGFRLKDSATRIQSLELCNRVNDNMIMIRCSIPESAGDMIYIDHYTMTDGGITGEEIVAATRSFARVIRGSFSEYDTDDILD